MNEFPSSINEIIEFFSKEGFENPELETRLIINEVFGTPFSDISFTDRYDFNSKVNAKLVSLWPDIKMGKPVQYIIGYTYVQGLRIRVSENTLCPGPEIDDVIITTSKIIRDTNAQIVVDLCTGCGVLGIVLAKEFPHLQVFATDISLPALEIALKNSEDHHLKNIRFSAGDLFNALDGFGLENKIDVLVSNPPYCKTDNIPLLPKQVKIFAPHIAIDGGADGLYFHKKIALQSKKYIKPGGYVVLENEAGQSDELQQLLWSSKFSITSCIYNKRNEARVVAARADYETSI